MDAVARQMSDTIADLQMALRVVRELINDGPGTPAQLAERMTENDDDGRVYEDGCVYDEQHVSDAIGVLDQFSLLSFPDEDLSSEVVGLWS